MPRSYTPRHSVTITKAAYDDLIAQANDHGTTSKAVLAGTSTGETSKVLLCINDNDADDLRATRRRQATEQDMDVIGGATITHDTLDQTIARTSDEQHGRRQTVFSPPEGHVFVHVHTIAGLPSICATVVHNLRLHHATVTVDDPTLLHTRKARRKAKRPAAATSKDE